MASNGLKEYHQFIQFRGELIESLMDISIAHEVRFLEAFGAIESIDEIKNKIKSRKIVKSLLERGVATEEWIEKLALNIQVRQIRKEKSVQKVRLVAVITTDEQYIHFKKQIDIWEKSVRKLNNIDPDTYPLNATVFNPMPCIISSARKITIANNKATAVRTIKKSVLLRRYKSYIASMQGKGDTIPASVLARLKAEMAAMEVDGETEYVSRNDKNNETSLSIYPIIGAQERKRVPIAGVIIDNRFNDLEISPAKKLAERGDTFQALQIREVPCSLPLVGGRLYPKRAVEKAKQIARESKLPISS